VNLLAAKQTSAYFVTSHCLAQHVATNAYTRYKPFPSPAQFSASPDLISRTTAFVRRELRVWENLDVEVRPFPVLTTYCCDLSLEE
jgi:hypothetical protein